MAKQKNNNAQVRQSKQWLTEALLNLMEEKSYPQISVQDIAQKTHLDRRTFYRHFASKDDVLDGYLLSIIMPYFEELEQSHLDSEYNLICHHFAFLQKHLPVLRLLKKQDLFGFLLVRYQSYIRLLRQRQGLTPITEPEEVFRLAFKTGGFFNVVSQWIEDDPVRPPEEMAQMVLHFLENGLSSLCVEDIEFL